MSFLLSLMLVTCSSGPERGPDVIDLSRRVRDVRIVERWPSVEPDWVMQPGDDPQHLRFVGSAEAAGKADAQSAAWQDVLTKIRQSIATDVGSVVDVEVDQAHESGRDGESFRSRIAYRSRSTASASGAVIHALQTRAHWYRQRKSFYIPHTGQDAGYEDTYHVDVLAEVDRSDFEALVDAARRQLDR